MRYGIVSDIHSNLEALLAALETLGEVDILVSAGDIIGYGPDPNACCEIMRERGAICALGNHDAAVTCRMTLDWFNHVAADALMWTREQITDENLAFVGGLPLVHRDESFILAHGALAMPQDYEYIASPWDARPTFAEMGLYDLCLIGHTHLAEFYFQKADEIWANQISMTAGGMIELEPNIRYIVNSGSVGQPRDFDRRASAAIYDSEARTVEILRVEYPVAVTQRKMRDAGLAESLARRLEHGA